MAAFAIYCRFLTTTRRWPRSSPIRPSSCASSWSDFPQPRQHLVGGSVDGDVGGSVDGDVGGPANAGGQLPSARARAEEIARSLYPHQVEGLAFLLGRRRSILADDMGLGKTRQSVLAMVEAEPTGPYLVICPATVKGNWVREILIVLPDAQTTIVGPARTPAADFSGWVIINYDLLKREVDALLQHRWSGLVFDEAHYLKNHRTIRNRLSMRL
ncbi:MAG TPA: hypothetical protein EYM39_11410, partial [Candidatus Latescibacteria bacterium]|nr:hypothetical protein [Candidatus Latescibacterota bacterium]